MAFRCFPGIFLLCFSVVFPVWSKDPGVASTARTFTVMAYNVENLMDIDRIAPYDDYAEVPGDPNSYGPGKLLRKLKTISRVLKSVDNGAGPDVVILNELEADHTPDTTVADMGAFLGKYGGTTYEKMLNPRVTGRGLADQSLGGRRPEGVCDSCWGSSCWSRRA
ncbi:MAG: hypothetical protein EBZ83_04350 [Verrucomicrobia bacterium]|nr:hypothetical protein [Verrucomicrobiota bacterium]